jgi:hypothetical protein
MVQRRRHIGRSKSNYEAAFDQGDAPAEQNAASCRKPRTDMYRLMGMQ